MNILQKITSEKAIVRVISFKFFTESNQISVIFTFGIEHPRI